MKAPVKRKKSTTTKGHYVTNAVLLPAVLRAKAEGRVTDELIGMIQQIATRYSLKHNFIGYSFREDMVAEAVRNLCVNALKFNPDRQAVPNPFSYYTSAINNSFLQYMNDEKKQRDIRDALLLDAGSNPSFNFMQREKDEGDFELKESDNVVDNGKESHYNPDSKDLEYDPHPERQPSEGKVIEKNDLIVDYTTGEIRRKSTGALITIDTSLIGKEPTAAALARMAEQRVQLEADRAAAIIEAAEKQKLAEAEALAKATAKKNGAAQKAEILAAFDEALAELPEEEASLVEAAMGEV